MAFGDDGSKIPGRPIVEEVLKDHVDQITFYETGMDFNAKLREGLVLGKMANEVIRSSKADIAIILCDDDLLHPSYLQNLSGFFTQSSALYCYSWIYLFNPIIQTSPDAVSLTNKYNQWEGPINPVNKVDASQVAWRLSCCKENGAWFADSTKCVPGQPWAKDTDKAFFENLYEKCGTCYPTNFVAQYKGIHDYQLLWHKSLGVDLLEKYHETCQDLGGSEF